MIGNNFSDAIKNDSEKIAKNTKISSDKKSVEKSSDTSKACSVTDKKEVEKVQRNLRSNKKFVQISDNFYTIYEFDKYFGKRSEDYYINLKQVLDDDFEIPEENRSNGNYKRFYCYLLLDSRKCKNNSWHKPNDWKYLNEPETGWKDFIDLIFYVGKGEGRRVWGHARDAEKELKINLKKYLTDNTEKTVSKCSVKKWIIEIWKTGGSVLIFIFDDYILTRKASTMEAAVIEAIGKTNLTNIKSSTYYGVAEIMTVLEKRQLGATILMRARNYLTERGITDQQDPPKILSSIEEDKSDDLQNLSEDLGALNIAQSTNSIL